ncbi:Imm17 family immunity protein [Plebeiibacterium sediminum]|uniref:Imm17 family immunity protein n=1 Tax=Plebeiibacterium sediminum TaxID=2992112 RepID=A0AAE3M8C8_9BACT|nr:Imm17 family immunity protein [Plebeiobacterium sediminum]MCW3789119.1 Imm17 family immunity protein [Plebeiobacterium sediminum]
MAQSNFLNWILLIFGLLIFAAALFNWQYFFKQRKAQMLTKVIGITGTRILYGILGLFFALIGANYLFELGVFTF